ncbi:MAG: SDR family NAD(P)-dependent oxidoreductase [Melioribacteraceae bacterium]|nr:SDR family NAD(P)-dependent oxidoreductase [Melioribacteraceae bacterium]MCF8352949.1 SDR family NAD(P)-dependent oxidoreductase [Melioribacteraceae bacterium]MCF8396368.1 SDR family NAD(P)-dependent oxidoreductase [Melioribacteraceae bacterium]MCF8417466.1 SDR family NAD(P)-dependent oxidoreductase [Melioribacteraceae bacterium]
MKKVLLIFGAAGNMGKGATKVLLDKNYDKYYVFDFDLSRVNYDNKKMNVVKIEDLSIEQNVEKAFSHIIADRKTEYYLFSTVGGFSGGKSISETDYELWLKMHKINLNTSFLLAKHFALLVEKSAGGAICFTSAETGLTPAPNKAAYGTAKSALIYFVQTLAEEGKSQKLSANVIAPYALDTEENREWVENTSKLVKASEIGEFVNHIFENHKSFSGKVFSLPEAIKQIK